MLSGFKYGTLSRSKSKRRMESSRIDMMPKQQSHIDVYLNNNMELPDALLKRVVGSKEYKMVNVNSVINYFSTPTSVIKWLKVLKVHLNEPMDCVYSVYMDCVFYHSITFLAQSIFFFAGNGAIRLKLKNRNNQETELEVNVSNSYSLSMNGKEIGWLVCEVNEFKLKHDILFNNYVNVYKQTNWTKYYAQIQDTKISLYNLNCAKLYEFDCTGFSEIVDVDRDFIDMKHTIGMKVVKLTFYLNFDSERLKKEWMGLVGNHLAQGNDQALEDFLMESGLAK